MNVCDLDFLYLVILLSVLWCAVPALLDSVRPILDSTSNICEALADVVPPNQFWRFKESWSNSLRTCVFVAALTHYLDNRTLITLPECAGRLGGLCRSLLFQIND